MSIGGARKFADVKRERFGTMAQEAGMRPQLAIDRLDRLVARIGSVAHTLSGELAAEWPSDVYAKIESVIADQVESL